MYETKALNPEELAKRYFWLAWKACGSPTGMGKLRDKPDATEEDVWDSVQNSGDYPNGRAKRVVGDVTKLSASHVFGRAMELAIEIGTNFARVDVDLADPTYQAWSRRYDSPVGILRAAYRELYKNEMEFAP